MDAADKVAKYSFPDRKLCEKIFAGSNLLT